MEVVFDFVELVRGETEVGFAKGGGGGVVVGIGGLALARGELDDGHHVECSKRLGAIIIRRGVNVNVNVNSIILSQVEGAVAAAAALDVIRENGGAASDADRRALGLGKEELSLLAECCTENHFVLFKGELIDLIIIYVQ